MNTDSLLRTMLVPLASCVLLAASQPALAATDYFLKFDGINGGATDKGHERWNDINSFNWSVLATASYTGGGGSGVGKPIFSDFSWTQELDSSFTPLFADISTGKHIKNAVVDFTSIGAKPQVYFKMTFDDVLLTGLALSATGTSDPLFAGSFTYGKVTLDYWAQNMDGSLGQKSSASYDVRTASGSPTAVAALFAQGLMGPQVTVVPEPESYAMFLAGLGILGAVARRRRIRA